MREYKAQLDPEESKKIEEHIAKLRKVIDNQEGAEAIRKEAGELQRASLKLFELVYKKMQASSGAAAGDAGSKPEDGNVKDADFKEKK